MREIKDYDYEVKGAVKSKYTRSVISLIGSGISKIFGKTIGRFIHILMAVDWKNVRLSVYVRWIAMIILVVNMFLEKAGMNPLPFSGTDVYELVSDILTAIMFVLNTYKNNSTSKEAIEADRILKEMREQQDSLDSEDYTSLK